MVFSTNQVRQLYVATDVKEGQAHVLPTDAVGSIALHANKAKSHMYFEYKGVGGLVRSDLIDTDKVLYAKATPASALARPLKKVTVTLDPSVNGGDPVGAQDYILRIAFRQYLGISDEDQYYKYGMVHAYTGMKPSEFYKTLAISLAKNFSRELVPLLKFKVGATEVTPSTKIEDIAGEADGLIIEEVIQPWTLGIQEQVPVYFEVYPTTVTFNSDERIWGKVTDNTPKKQEDGSWDPALVINGANANAVGGGKTIADLEYFCLGERADQYRNVGWPNAIPSKTLVDPTKEYHVLDIHYAYVGSNECVQKSEKDITIVSDNKEDINTLVNALNAATGMEIASLV